MKRIFILSLLLLSSAALAQDYTWENVVQTVNIQADGSVVVRDERTLTTDEDFGEAFVCLNLGQGQSVTLLDGGAISPGPAARAYTQPCENGSGGTELVVAQDDRVDERRVFFRYRLNGSLEVYSDVVQWYWKILEEEHPPVEGYDLTVKTPGAMEAPFDAYVHRLGNPGTPTVELSNDRQQLTVHYNEIPDDVGVEIRYFMPPALFTVKGQELGFDRLLQNEAEVANLEQLQAEAQARRERTQRNPLWALPVLPILALLIGGVVRGTQRRRDSEPPAMQYPFEPPADRPPAAVSYFTSKMSTSNSSPAFHATIMDLARRGYGAFDAQGKKFNMRLSGKDDSELLPFERDVLNYLKRAAASDSRSDPDYLDFKELKRYSESNLSSFLSSWWNDVGLWLSKELGGPRLDGTSVRNAVLLLVLGILSAGGLFFGGILTLGLPQIIFFIAAATSLVFGFIAISNIPTWRREVAAEALGWQGFRRTLSDYTEMKNAPDDFFKLWEKYYCYAAALGVADKFLKNMARAAPERGDTSFTTTPLWLGNMGGSSLNSLSEVTSSLSSLSTALSSAGASASSGGSIGGGGGGGGGGSSGGR